MKNNRRIRSWLLGCMCLLMCGFNACDPDNGDDDDDDDTNVTVVTPYQLTISGACKATDSTGAEIAQLDLVAGQEVTYCNNWTAQAELKFSVAGFLPGGALAQTLAPGECLTYIVDASVVDGDYLWSLSCEGYSGGMGGGPVKVDNPPPGP